MSSRKKLLLSQFGNSHSVRFDGVNDYVTAGSAADFKYYHGATNTSAFAFTISVWVKFDNPNANTFQVIFDSCNTLTANVGITLALDSRTAVPRSRSIQSYIYRGVGGTAVVQSVSVNNVYPNSTGWNHILWTHNQALASANTNIYVNNVLVTTTNKTGQTPSTANSIAALRFGITTSNTNPISGYQYHPIFINKVLNSTERTELYSNPYKDARTLSFAEKVTNAYRFPNGAADFPAWTDYLGGINGTMTNQSSSDIILDRP